MAFEDRTNVYRGTFYAQNGEWTIVDGQNSGIIPIQAGNAVAIRVLPGSGATGIVKTSMSLESKVIAGTAVFKKWELGDITESTPEGQETGYCPPCLTGIYFESTGGTTVFEVSLNGAK